MKNKGLVITLAPGLANCGRILHLDLARFMEKPQETIKNCLTAALDNNAKCRSVAFPALGTGELVLSHLHAAIFHRSSIVGMSSHPPTCLPLPLALQSHQYYCNWTCGPFLILGSGEAGDCQGETVTLE